MAHLDRGRSRSAPSFAHVVRTAVAARAHVPVAQEGVLLASSGQGEDARRCCRKGTPVRGSTRYRRVSPAHRIAVVCLVSPASAPVCPVPRCCPCRRAAAVIRRLQCGRERSRTVRHTDPTAIEFVAELFTVVIIYRPNGLIVRILAIAAYSAPKIPIALSFPLHIRTFESSRQVSSHAALPSHCFDPMPVG